VVRAGTYVPGAFAAAVSGSTIVVWDHLSSQSSVDRVWALVQEGAEALVLVRALHPDRADDDLPAFAVVRRSGSSTEAVVRGDVKVVLRTTGGEIPLAAPTVPTWLRLQVEGVTDATVHAGDRPEGAGPALPLCSGVVPVSVLGWSFEDAVAVPVPMVDAATSDAATSDDDDVLGAADVHPARSPVPELTWTPEPDALPAGPESAAARAATPADVAPAAAEESVSYAFLHGRRAGRAVAEAPVDAFAPTCASVDEFVTATDAPTPSDGGTPVAGADGGLITARWGLGRGTEPVAPEPVGVPAWRVAAAGAVTSGEPAPVPGPAGPDRQGDHDDMTVRRTDLGVPGAAADAEQVYAASCPAGHPNPPHASTCRVCREPVAEQEPLLVRRPPLGRLVSDVGVEVVLDGPSVVGRTPRNTGLVAGRVPALVAVPSPGQDVSRSHVEVRVEGWSVSVVDLGSVNGTFVTRPGEQPQRLRPGQEALVLPGTRIVLANEVTFVFEVQ